MKEFINKLHEKTQTLEIMAAPGYPKCIGIRSTDSIIIDDEAVLIYGDMYYGVDGSDVKITDFNVITDLDPQFVRIKLGAQILVQGHFIRIDLGTYTYDCFSQGQDRVYFDVTRFSY